MFLEKYLTEYDDSLSGESGAERKDNKELRRTYLRPMANEGLLKLKYPETVSHPHQVYVTAEKQ